MSVFVLIFAFEPALDQLRSMIAVLPEAPLPLISI